MHFKKRISSLAFVLLLVGCVALHDKTPSKEMEPANAQEVSAPEEEVEGEKGVIKDLELKQARIWSRIDELESMLLKQQERVKLLEQALLVGHGAGDKKDTKSVQQPEERQRSSIEHPKNDSVQHDADAAKKKRDTAAIALNYAKRMHDAKELFGQSLWNKAFVAFSEIDREADTALSQGEPLYWIARCWYQLNEFQSAKTFLTRFLELAPHHKLASSARLFIAKSDMALGRKDQAMNVLQDLVKTLPNEENSEMAKQMLQHINEEGL